MPDQNKWIERLDDLARGELLTIFSVWGNPRQRGSKRHIGRGRLVDEAKGSAEWMDLISFHARNAYRYKPTLRPVHVRIRFMIPRPKQHFDANGGYAAGCEDLICAKSPDIDKLCRAALDGMTRVVFADDKQVCKLEATRVWAYQNKGKDAGAMIAVYYIDPRHRVISEQKLNGATYAINP